MVRFCLTNPSLGEATIWNWSSWKRTPCRGPQSSVGAFQARSKGFWEYSGHLVEFNPSAQRQSHSSRVSSSALQSNRVQCDMSSDGNGQMRLSLSALRDTAEIKMQWAAVPRQIHSLSYGLLKLALAAHLKSVCRTYWQQKQLKKVVIS